MQQYCQSLSICKLPSSFVRILLLVAAKGKYLILMVYLWIYYYLWLQMSWGSWANVWSIKLYPIFYFYFLCMMTFCPSSSIDWRFICDQRNDGELKSVCCLVKLYLTMPSRSLSLYNIQYVNRIDCEFVQTYRKNVKKKSNYNET